MDGRSNVDNDDDGYAGESDDEEALDADDDLARRPRRHEAEPEVELSLQRERARREAMSSLMRATNACVAGERTDPYADCFSQSHYMATDCPPERLPRSSSRSHARSWCVLVQVGTVFCARFGCAVRPCFTIQVMSLSSLY